MTQVTWRAPDHVVEHARLAAAREGRSLNEYITRVIQAATDPALAGSDVERLQERLARAGLLVPEDPLRRQRPDPKVVEEARREAGRGTPLSDLVVEGRG
jgi:hypothetical protein